MSGWSIKDSESLERIANALERLVTLQEQPVNGMVNLEKLFEFEPNVNEVEDEFFRLVTRVYFEEGELVKQRGGGRKSSVRVANQFSMLYPDFFMEKLPEIDVEVGRGGLLIFRRSEKALCAVKIYTDLGYNRGESWYKNIEEFVKESTSYGITADRVFFLVISFRNGLQNDHVKQLLGFDISNRDLLEPQNRKHLEEYAWRYVEGTRDFLPHPHDQVYFLAGKLHPNVLEEALEEDLTTYQWFRPSVTELLQKIKSL